MSIEVVFALLVGVFSGIRLALAARERSDRCLREIAALEWFALPDGRLGFRGRLGGYSRQITGEKHRVLIAIAERMARGEA